MDGERKLTVFTFGLSMFCITILYSFLFVSLWRYKELVGLTLLIVLVGLAVVFAKGKLNEQGLRQARYRYNEEIPLDDHGEVHYRPQWAQENPYHTPSRVSARTSRHSYSSAPHDYEHEWSEGYPQQQQSRY